MRKSSVCPFANVPIRRPEKKTRLLQIGKLNYDHSFGSVNTRAGNKIKIKPNIQFVIRNLVEVLMQFFSRVFKILIASTENSR